MSLRLAVRAVLLHRDRLLLVNAYPSVRGSDLWCAPGGGVEPQASLPDNLVREVREETGLEIRVDAPCLVNEFHDPDSDFHQVELFFRCRLRRGLLDDAHRDPEGVVDRRGWFAQAEVAAMRVKPSSLAAVAWGDADALFYDPLERIVG